MGYDYEMCTISDTPFIINFSMIALLLGITGITSAFTRYIMNDIVAHVLLANTKIYDVDNDDNNNDNSLDNSFSTSIYMWTNMFTTLTTCFKTSRITKINPIHVEILDAVDINVASGRNEVGLGGILGFSDQDKNDKDKLIPVHTHTRKYKNNHKTISGAFFKRILSKLIG